MSPSTRPAPTVPPPAIAVPVSAKKKPNVTMLVPSPSSAPTRARLPPRRMSSALTVQTAR